MKYKEFKHPSIVVKPSELSEKSIQSLYAKIILEHSLFQGKRDRLMSQIDDALDQKDEWLFDHVSSQYNELLQSYEKGISIYEEGMHFQIFFTENGET